MPPRVGGVHNRSNTTLTCPFLYTRPAVGIAVGFSLFSLHVCRAVCLRLSFFQVGVSVLGRSVCAEAELGCVSGGKTGSVTCSTRKVGSIKAQQMRGEFMEDSTEGGGRDFSP